MPRSILYVIDARLKFHRGYRSGIHQELLPEFLRDFFFQRFLRYFFRKIFQKLSQDSFRISSRKLLETSAKVQSIIYPSMFNLFIIFTKELTEHSFCDFSKDCFRNYTDVVVQNSKRFHSKVV